MGTAELGEDRRRPEGDFNHFPDKYLCQFDYFGEGGPDRR
jgi:hypothetical protein